MERIAINVDDARIPNNISQQPIDEAIQLDGEAAYFTTLPIKRIVKAIREAGISAEVSNSAGTFVCNHIMYQALFAATKADKPFLKQALCIFRLFRAKTDKPSLPLEESTKAVQIAIETIRDYINDEDIKVQEGPFFRKEEMNNVTKSCIYSYPFFVRIFVITAISIKSLLKGNQSMSILNY